MSDLGPPKIFSFSELAAMEMERDAALARAEAAHVRLVEVIKGVQDERDAALARAEKAAAERDAIAEEFATASCYATEYLKRAEKSEKQHAADAAKDAYVIYRAQRQAERLAKHALRYRAARFDEMASNVKWIAKNAMKTVDLQAERDRLRAAVAAADAVMAMIDDDDNQNWFRHTEAADAYRTARKQIEGK